MALKQVVRILIQKRLSLAVAESVTGGLLAKLVTDVPGASACFLGGVVAYANTSKVTQLGVTAHLVTRHGAVSKEVAGAMARGICRRFGATVGVSTTGIAGPTGGRPLASHRTTKQPLAAQPTGGRPLASHRTTKQPLAAQPTGGSKEKPVGLVYIGVHYGGNTHVTRLQLRGARHEIREQAAQATLTYLAQCLKR